MDIQKHRFLDESDPGNWQVVFKVDNEDFARIDFPGSLSWEALCEKATLWARSEELRFKSQGHPITLRAVVERW